MIQILIKVTGSTYIAVVDQTSGTVSGDPETIATELNVGFLLEENSGFIQTELNNFFLLEK